MQASRNSLINRKEEFKKLRTTIASSFRDFIFSRDYPDWLHRSEGSTVSHVPKEDVAVKDRLKDYYKFISEAIVEWDLETFAGLLTPQAIEYFDSGKIAQMNSEAAKERTVRRMVKTALDTVAGANGQQVLRAVKNKESRFTTLQNFEKYIAEIVDAQAGFCAITGLVLQFDGQSDDQELLYSLDRIDSDGHYEAGNLQVVCRFVNRWKNDGNDIEFRRLIGLVSNAGAKKAAQPPATD